VSLVAWATGKEAGMSPGPNATQRPQTTDRERVDFESGPLQAEAFVPLDDDHRRLVAVLQTQRHGMTFHQLQTRLVRPSGEVRSMLETVLERQLVARLNTIVPSYIYRYSGVDLDAD
jgi:hypothetical protein